MGKTIVAGGGRATVPISGIKASELSVGSVVKLMESGTEVEYLVVHQGLPSSMYDASCDGCWLARKNLYTSMQGNGSTSGNYLSSNIHSYLNNTFLGVFNADTRAAIKNVKLPYIATPGNQTVTSGASGMDAKVFSLSYPEVGLSYSQYFPNDGSALSYFTGGSSRIATLSGVATQYWLRSFSVSQSGYCGTVKDNGGYTEVAITTTQGIRPALILPSNAIFDKNTLIFKGVA